MKIRSLLLLVLWLVTGCGGESAAPRPASSERLDGGKAPPEGERDAAASPGAPASDAAGDRTANDSGPSAMTSEEQRDASSGRPSGLFDDARLIEEIDPCELEPVYESAKGVSAVSMALARCTRVMLPSAEPKVMAYRIGAGQGLRPGASYLLEVEYPDDVPRGFFMINRGADLARGWATGTATGDSRRQYVNATIESLAYPQQQRWERYRQLFFLNDRMQGVHGVRDSEPQAFAHTPEEGFHVVLFQVPRAYDLRSEGVAIGKIRLYEVPDVSRSYVQVERPPAELPQRHVFFREEMSDMIIQGREPEARGVTTPVDWYRYKMKMSKVLGIDVFAKDLLEFGHNGGWASGDLAWFNEAQPPNQDLWASIVATAAEEGMPLMPYYEYKGAIGWAQPNTSLGHQRRARKLYHGIHKSCDDLRTDKYTCTSWVEDQNADLTDPDTLVDIKRVLDKTVGRFRGQAEFVGAWLRTRQNHLPMSFSSEAIARYRADHPDDPAARAATQASLIASYEGDRALYESYVGWWFRERREFLQAVQQHLASVSGHQDAQLLFTPWVSEAVPPPGPGFLTDDPAFFSRWVAAQPASDDTRWRWQPASFAELVASGAYGLGLRSAPDIRKAYRLVEEFHAAPYADPERYRDVENVMMSYPIGRMIALADAALVRSFVAASGLSVTHHFTLNEDNAKRGDSSLEVPFRGEVGYVAVDVDRAGAHLMLHEARALAAGDPRNLAILTGSSFSSGFPQQMRDFHRAFLALPALPSTPLPAASDDPEVVVREVATPRHGSYYSVVNTSMRTKRVRITLPAARTVRDLVQGVALPPGPLELELESAALRAYRTEK